MYKAAAGWIGFEPTANALSVVQHQGIRLAGQSVVTRISTFVLPQSPVSGRLVHIATLYTFVAAASRHIFACVDHTGGQGERVPNKKTLSGL